MEFKSVEIVKVKLTLGDKIVDVGRLALKNRKILFEYFDDFLDSKLELSPFKLPLKRGVIVCDDNVFNGLFGVFNDSLPDGWGRLLLDRKLSKNGISPMAITPLDRLCYVGKNGMGALIYEPEIDDTKIDKIKELDEIADECFEIQNNDSDEFVDELLLMNGSSAGARPKILVSLARDDKIERTKSNPKTTHDNWIIKFRSSTDPKDIGQIEYAYHLMAKAAGLDVPEARLFSSKKCGGYFGVKRFDRQNSSFKHMHTASGLLHADHRVLALDYETLLQATAHLTRDVKECEKQFRNMVFNILAHNRDDHAKNFSFLMDESGDWKVSPAYDLTFSSGPMGQHCTTVLGEGERPRIEDIFKLGEMVSVKRERCEEIFEEVRSGVEKWGEICREVKLSSSTKSMIGDIIKR